MSNSPSLLNIASKEESVLRIWDDHWGSNAPGVTENLRSRFAKEAFDRIDSFVTENDQTILEVGCGTGRFSTLLAHRHPGKEIIGVDLSENALEMARQATRDFPSRNLSFQQADLFHLPFPDGRFDMVFSEGVIQLFSMTETPTYADALAEMKRVVKPGGKIVVSVINWHCYPHTIYKWLLRLRGVPYEYGYEKSFKRNELCRLLQRNGLNEIQFSGYYPAHALYRQAWRSRFFRDAGRTIDMIEKICDLIQKNWFSGIFGIEIMAKGVKDHPTPSLRTEAEFTSRPL